MLARAREAGLKMGSGWNVSSILARTRGLAIHTPNGWELTDSGKQRLQKLGVNKISPAAAQVATDLRSELANIHDHDTRAFVEEAIKCYEFELYRSAMVMSWLAAVDVLHSYVHKNYLSQFNAEARKQDVKWKDAKTTDDLGRMKESLFLELLHTLSTIDGDVKKELKHCLDRRNSCGHPNSLKLGANTVAHHIEILLLNVFKVFQ
jgi:hypothetical protein